MWDALAGGAIPIYAGAPNVQEHLPHSDAVIAADMRDPARTAALIRLLDADPAAAARYLGWRVADASEIAPAFSARINDLEGPRAPSRPETPCGLCERLWRTRHHLDI